MPVYGPGSQSRTVYGLKRIFTNQKAVTCVGWSVI